jgi:hypothetical protein
MKSFVCLLAGLLFLTGCASTPYSAAQKAGIHTIQLQPITADVEMRFGVDANQPDDPYSAASTDMMNNVGEYGLRQMKKEMYNQHINVPQLIQDSVEKRLRQQTVLVVTDQPSADGVLTVKVLQYGYSDMPFSLMHEIPFVILQVELRDKNDHVIWTKKNTWSPPSEDEAGSSWDEYEAHPDDLRNAWTSQISQTVNSLIPLSNK